MELHVHEMSGAAPSQRCPWAVSHCRCARIPVFRTRPAPYPKIPLFAFPWRVQRAPFRFAKSEAWQMTELCPQPQRGDYSLGDLLNKALPPFFGCFNGILRNLSQHPQGGNLPFFLLKWEWETWDLGSDFQVSCTCESRYRMNALWVLSKKTHEILVSLWGQIFSQVIL